MRAWHATHIRGQRGPRRRCRLRRRGRGSGGAVRALACEGINTAHGGGWARHGAGVRAVGPTARERVRVGLEHVSEAGASDWHFCRERWRRGVDGDERRDLVEEALVELLLVKKPGISAATAPHRWAEENGLSPARCRRGIFCVSVTQPSPYPAIELDVECRVVLVVHRIRHLAGQRPRTARPLHVTAAGWRADLVRLDAPGM
jgi:hypothetical protein